MTDSVDPEAAVGPTVSFGFNLAKVPDHGEDSDPILRDGPDLGLAAVFDGMGGAGGTVYETAHEQRSGAYLASRIARTVVEELLLDRLAPEQPLSGAAAASAVHDAVEAALQAELAELKAPTSRLRSRLLRALPTTMALGVLQRTESGGSEWACQVLWAGDSRVYALTPDGLRQLSVDDLRDPGDAMTNLEHDSVISNALSADTEFEVRHRRVLLTAPFVLVTATDGCFGYLRSPMHFEALLLDALLGASDDDGWSTAIQQKIAAVTGDDASMAAIAVGADIAELQRILHPRLAAVQERFTDPMDALLGEVELAEESLARLHAQRIRDTAARWQDYRDGYEALLHQSNEADLAGADEPTQRQIWNPPKPIATGTALAFGMTGTTEGADA